MAKILLIEDDLMISGMYANKFKKEGFEVESAKDGKEAYCKLEEKQFDLILLDKALPDVDGIEILRNIKTNPKSKNNQAIVILLTNVSEKNDAEDAKKIGAQDYLVKAYFTPTEIVDKVKNILKPKIY